MCAENKYVMPNGDFPKWFQRTLILGMAGLLVTVTLGWANTINQSITANTSKIETTQVYLSDLNKRLTSMETAIVYLKESNERDHERILAALEKFSQRQ